MNGDEGIFGEKVPGQPDELIPYGQGKHDNKGMGPDIRCYNIQSQTHLPIDLGDHLLGRGMKPFSGDIIGMRGLMILMDRVVALFSFFEKYGVKSKNNL